MTLDTFLFIRGGGGGGDGGGGAGGGACGGDYDDDEDYDDDPNGMYADGPSESEKPATKDDENGKPDETDTMGEATPRSEHQLANTVIMDFLR